MATLTARVLRYIARQKRCQSATEIAHAVGERPATVSGILARAARRGRVKRFLRSKIYPERAGARKDAWVY